MRKFLFVALMSGALAVAMPATAVARHHHRHHHHSRIRHEHFGTAGGTTTTTSGGSTSGDEMQGTAGTVQSFTGGVLTILLNDGTSTVSGMVTSATELKCEAPENEMTETEGDGSGSGDRIAMDDGGGSSGGDDSSGDDGSGDGSDDGVSMCTTANLTPGTVVQEAELNISSAGAVWHEVELVTP
jgi:hypothetical protein